ncbi:MAG TPA: cation-translocating P-type ATPase [Candidatus Poseidoniales archaeon]|nr:cation-translocating P-type ATPase [Candidatus Poseidoniales archaeon]HIK99848.1 cation-translocating P-type ATPase [Candidatus Poseidoniales archaeon]
MGSEDFLILDDEEDVDPNVVETNPKTTESTTFGSLIQPVSKFMSNLSKQTRKITSRLSEKKVAAKTLDEVILTEEIEAGNEDVVADLVFAADGICEFEWGITGMDCPDCAMKATKAVSRLPGIDEVNISVAEGNVRFKLDLSKGRVSRANSVLASLGNNPDIAWMAIVGLTPGGVANRLGIERRGLRSSLLDIPGIIDVRFEDGRIELQRVNLHSRATHEISETRLTQILGTKPQFEESQSSRLRADQIQLLSALLTIPLLAGVYTIDQIEVAPSWSAMLITVVGIAFAGFPMFNAALSSIQNRVLGFQVLTTLAVIGALAMKQWPEALAVTGLVAFASHLEDRALVRARESMQGGLDRLPRRARLVENSKDQSQCHEDDDCCDDHGHSESDVHDDEWTPVEALNLGDVVEIRSGEIVPVDGIIIEGSGAIDRAPLTGEPIPISISVGDRVEAGLVLVRGPVIVRAEASGDDTRLASLIELVRKYREQPTRTQSTIEKFTAFWVPFVLIGSLAYGFWTKDFTTMLVLWVVSCPCSLLLAAPVPHATALSAAASSGLVARGGDVLEAAASIELALLDKTGTLTSGRPKISEIIVAKGHSENSVLRLAAGIEQRSNHPYAQTIILAAEDAGLDSEKVSNITDGDAGISAELNGKAVMFGRADWLESEGISISKEIQSALNKFQKSGHGASLLAIEGIGIAVFGFIHDDAREGVVEMIEMLQKHGISVEILSGDEQSSVEAFAKHLGLDPKICRGNVDPEGKADWVTKKSLARKTLMAGDGFNDAGALAAADVGVAVGSGERVNLDAADVLIPGEDPRALARLVELAKRTRHIVNINIMISVVITTILVISSLVGLNSSIAAGIAIHEASVFLIIINGMFVTGQGGNRISVLTDLGKEVVRDIKEAFAVLLKAKTTTA